MTLINPSIISLQVVGENTNEFDADSGSTNGKITLSDHSRSPLSISYDIIENMVRMADGTARRQVISKKKIFSCEWTMLPTVKTYVVDGKADALDVRDFFTTYSPEPMTLSIYHKRNSAATTAYKEDTLVYLTNFNYDVAKRFKNFDYWNLSIEFTEI